MNTTGEWRGARRGAAAAAPRLGIFLRSGTNRFAGIIFRETFGRPRPKSRVRENRPARKFGRGDFGKTRPARGWIWEASSPPDFILRDSGPRAAVPMTANPMTANIFLDIWIHAEAK